MILRFGHNPLGQFTPVLTVRAAQPKFRILSYLLSLKLPVLYLPQCLVRHFLRIRLSHSRVCLQATGPVPVSAETLFFILVFEVTLCSFHTTQRLSGLDSDFPTFLLRRPSCKPDTYTVPGPHFSIGYPFFNGVPIKKWVLHCHLRLSVLTFPDLGRFLRPCATALSLVTVR